MLKEVFQSKYYAGSDSCISLGTLVPKSMSFEQKRFIQRLKAEIGDIDEYVAKKLHYKSVKDLCYFNGDTRFSKEQIDAIAIAIYNHEKTGHSAIIADQTGVGKGRIAAGLIRYAILEKKVVPFFITEKKNLIHDIYRDLIDIGFDAGVPEMVLTKSEDVPQKYTDEYILNLIKEDVFQNETLRIEYDLEEDFDLTSIFNDENIELLEDIIEEYKNYLENENPLYVYEKNTNFKKQLDEAKKNGLFQVKPFTPFPFDVKDKNGNILYSNKNKDIDYFIEKGSISSDYKLITFPYSQIQKPYDRKKQLTNKAKFLLTMALNTVVILDESHTASGFKPTGELTNIAQMIQSIIDSASMVTYMSATFAKRADNMFIYALKNSINETGLSPIALKNAFEKGDVALQEAVSSELVRCGQLIRREKEITGETTYLKESDDTEVGISQVNKLNKVAEIFSKIKTFEGLVKSTLKEVLKDYKAENEYVFAGKIGRFQFQLFQFFLLGIKTQQTVKEALEQLKSGRKVVIAIANTLESVFKNIKKDFIKDINYEIGDEIKNDFVLFLLYFLDYTLKIAKLETVVDNEGKISVERKIIRIKKSENIIAKNVYSIVENEYRKLLEEISEISIGIPLSPIDQIKSIISSKNFTIDEITGRGIGLEFRNNDYSKGKLIKRTIRKREEIIRDFNTNKIDCLIINQSGAVGVSMHATKYGDVDIVLPNPPTSLENPKEVKQRCMIITQMELDINKEVQKLGRINRTGQVYPPVYRYIISCIPSESRLTALNEKKLRSLSANVSSDQKASSYLFEAEDFYSNIAIEPFNETMADMNQSFRANKKSDIEEYTKTLYFKPYNFQKQFYDLFTQKLNKHIQFLKDNNLYQGSVTLKDYKAKTNEIYPFIIGNNISLSPFGRHSFLEYCTCTEYKFKKLDYDITNSINDKLIAAKDEQDRKSFKDIESFVKYYDNYFKEKLENIKKFIDQNILEKENLINEIEIKISELKEKQNLLPKFVEALSIKNKINDLVEQIKLDTEKSVELLKNGRIDEMAELTINVGKKQKELTELKNQLEQNEEYQELLKDEESFIKIEREIEINEASIEKAKKNIQSLLNDYEEYKKNVSIAREYYLNIGKIFYVTVLNEDLQVIYDEDDNMIGEKYVYTTVFENEPYVLTGFSYDANVDSKSITLGNMTIYLSGVSDKETFTLAKAHRIFNENEINKGKKNTLILKNSNLFYSNDTGNGLSEWNKIASEKDTSYQVDKYILTGSLLKCFSLLKNLNIDGSITKYTTEDGKQRLGIELSKNASESFKNYISKEIYPVYLDLIPDNFNRLILDYFIKSKENSYSKHVYELSLSGYNNKAFLILQYNSYEKKVNIRVKSEKLNFCEYLLIFVKQANVNCLKYGKKQTPSKVIDGAYYEDLRFDEWYWKISKGINLYVDTFPVNNSTYEDFYYYKNINVNYSLEFNVDDFIKLLQVLQTQKILITTATSNLVLETQKDYYIFEQYADEIADLNIGSEDQLYVQDKISEEVELEIDEIINKLLDLLR